MKKCSTLLDFKPPLWGMGALMQLFLAITCPAPQIKYYTESLEMRDGGTVLLDWLERPGSRQGAPVLLMLHGIGMFQCRSAVLPTTTVIAAHTASHR